MMDKRIYRVKVINTITVSSFRTEDNPSISDQLGLVDSEINNPSVHVII